MAGASIGWLKLKGSALKAATELQKQCPKVVFTSGRREIKDQARAMSQNIVADKTYLKKTYKTSKAKSACVEWVDSNECKSAKDVEAGLMDVFNKLSDTDVQKISRHLGGLAFDVKPNSVDLKTLKDIVKNNGGEFLDHEGKLCRWHAQFTK